MTHTQECRYLSTHGLVAGIREDEPLNGWVSVRSQYLLNDNHEPIGAYLGGLHLIPISALLPMVKGTPIERVKAILFDTDAPGPFVAAALLVSLAALVVACRPIIEWVS